MKTFNHNLLDLPKLERIDGDLRYYKTPCGKLYPSATTVLGKTADKDFLVKWQNRVGIDEAEKIKNRSAIRGTAVHNMCENLVLNRPIDYSKQMPFNVNLFNQIKKVLIENVDNIRASEATLFSHKLKMAGSVDLVADYRGKPAIIDFKTSIRNKKPEWIVDYRLQTTAYSIMLHEMTGIICPRISIIICIEEENQAQVFEDKVANWTKELFSRSNQFHVAVDAGLM